MTFVDTVFLKSLIVDSYCFSSYTKSQAQGLSKSFEGYLIHNNIKNGFAAASGKSFEYLTAYKVCSFTQFQNYHFFFNNEPC